MAKARVNIYLDNPDIRRKVKTAAAKRDLSISQYCLRAIREKLIEEGEDDAASGRPLLHRTISKARRFQAKAFRGRMFKVSSVSLIGEARKERVRRS